MRANVMETKMKEGLESLSVIGWGRWLWHTHIRTHMYSLTRVFVL